MINLRLAIAVCSLTGAILTSGASADTPVIRTSTLELGLAPEGFWLKSSGQVVFDHGELFQ